MYILAMTEPGKFYTMSISVCKEGKHMHWSDRQEVVKQRRLPYLHVSMILLRVKSNSMAEISGLLKRVNAREGLDLYCRSHFFLPEQCGIIFCMAMISTSVIRM